MSEQYLILLFIQILGLCLTWSVVEADDDKWILNPYDNENIYIFFLFVYLKEEYLAAGCNC